MALMDSARPLLWVGAFAATAAAGFAVGYMVGRDPTIVRRWARAVAGSVERGQVALAEARENLADIWADVREEARGEMEEAAFAQAAAATAAAANSAKRASRPTATATGRSAGRKIRTARPKSATPRARRRPAKTQATRVERESQAPAVEPDVISRARSA